MDASHVFDPVSDSRSAASTAGLPLSSSPHPAPTALARGPAVYNAYGFGTDFLFSNARLSDSFAADSLGRDARSFELAAVGGSASAPLPEVARRLHVALLAIEAFALSSMGQTLWFTALRADTSAGFTRGLCQLCCLVWEERAPLQPLMGGLEVPFTPDICIRYNGLLAVHSVTVAEMAARVALCAMLQYPVRTGPPPDPAWLGAVLARAISCSLNPGGVSPTAAVSVSSAVLPRAASPAPGDAPAPDAPSVASLLSAVDRCSAAAGVAGARFDAAIVSMDSTNATVAALAQHVVSLAAEQHSFGGSLHSVRLDVLDLQEDLGLDVSLPVVHERFRIIEARLVNVAI